MAGGRGRFVSPPSVWNRLRGPQAAAVTQLLAAALHVSARRAAGKLKGRTQLPNGHRKDSEHPNCSTVNDLETGVLFSMSN